MVPCSGIEHADLQDLSVAVQGVWLGPYDNHIRLDLNGHHISLGGFIDRFLYILSFALQDNPS